MKTGIHPNYVDAKFICSSCNTEVETHAAIPLMRLDICANCHPFYTGKKRVIDTAGRVDRFNQRRNAGEAAKPEAKSGRR